MSLNLRLSSSGTYYVAPIPLGQAPVQVVAYQPPPGYALVPMAEVSWNVFSLNKQLVSCCSHTYVFSPSHIAKKCFSEDNWKSKLFRSNSCFLFQLQATGNPSDPPSYEKAVA